MHCCQNWHLLIQTAKRRYAAAEKFEEGKNFHLHETHFDIIMAVPPMVTVLGSSKNTPVQMCCVADHFLGMHLTLTSCIMHLFGAVSLDASLSTCPLQCSLHLHFPFGPPPGAAVSLLFPVA